MKGLQLPVLDDSATEESTLYLLYGLVRALRPALIVEAGTYMGHATAIMAMALKQAGVDGEIWSADPVDYGAEKVIEVNGLGSYVTLFRGPYEEMMADHLRHRRISMAFIDSGPVGGVVETLASIRYQHINMTRPCMKEHGVMVVDDVAGDWVGVEEIRSLPGIYFPLGRGVKLCQPFSL